MGTATQVARMVRAQAVRVSETPRRQARTTAQVVRISRAPRDPGGKWGGRDAPPIQ